ncbi:MAG: MFS transporter [Cyclobacteriaceae bacterium]
MQKPKLSFWQIWNMSFGFLGIQFGWALQLANGSRIFQSLGADPSEIPILWIAAPVTGLLVQPVIGHMSDNTWNKLGRRKPYFLVGAILASIALCFMPFSPVLWMAAGVLWILDASINISMEPFRAFVGDMLPEEQRTKGFAMQSFFIGIGSVTASLLPYILANWFGVSNNAPEGEISDSIKISFVAGGIVFLICVLWTVLRTKEYSPEELEKFQKEEEDRKNVADQEDAANDDHIKPGFFYKNGPIWIAVGLILLYLILTFTHHQEPIILAAGLILFGIIQLLTGFLTSKGKHHVGLVEVINDLFKMPTTMKQLAWVQFFSWFGLFSMFIYSVPAITSHIYGTEDVNSSLYGEGSDWVGVLFATYNLVAALVAFLLAPLSKKIGRKTVHQLALVAGGVGLISMFFINDPDYLVISMIGVGFAWASILSIPYAILTGSLPIRKFGIYMGIFNFFIVIPEITASSIYGYLFEEWFDEKSIYVIIAGGLSLMIAAIMVFFVNDKEKTAK